VTDQEILNRIDAEIARVHAIDGKNDSQETQLSQGTQLALTQLALVAYTHGLKFAKALIEKRTEEVAF
jgi:hypothetical protein